MGLAVYVRQKNGEEKAYFPVIGATGLKEIWRPIIDRRELVYIEHLASAGISVNQENCQPLLAEFQILFDEMKSEDPDWRNSNNPTSRCQRIIELLTDYCANPTVEIYIG